MTMLRDLLATWENWSARDTLTRALGNVTSGEGREQITASLDNTPATSAMDALHASAELVELLTSWQWQAMYAARRDGASWEEIGTAAHTSANAARAAFTRTIDRHESVLSKDVGAYRALV